MAIFTAQTLGQAVGRVNMTKSVQDNIRRAATDSRDVWVFLSHSHKDVADVDDTTLQRIRLLLADSNAKVYIDSIDPTMPATTSAGTGVALKKRIRECDKFVVVATENALNSKWVPWELGYADPVKSLGNVAVLPITSSGMSGEWAKSEYFGMYSRIEGEATPYASSLYAVQPVTAVVKTHDGKSTPLSLWLRS